MQKMYRKPTLRTFLFPMDVITSSYGDFGFFSENDVTGMDPGFWGEEK